MKNIDSSFNLEIDEALAAKFSDILSEENLMHAGCCSHQTNNINNGIDEISEC
jgi:hypothetical protein